MNYNHNKRAHKRIPVRLQGNLTTRYETYSAVIKNISTHGLALIFSSMPSPLIFDSDADLEAVIQISANKSLKVSARKKWYKRIDQLNNLHKEIGIEISHPSSEYLQFYWRFRKKLCPCGHGRHDGRGYACSSYSCFPYC